MSKTLDFYNPANGILKDHLSKIFKPFFSTKPTTGTGLGLSFISKEDEE